MIKDILFKIIFLLNRANITAESLSADTRLIMEEISKSLNLEKVLQCYKYTVTVECLRALRKLQKFGHLPNNIDLFKTYAVYGQFFGKFRQCYNNYSAGCFVVFEN